MNISSSFFQTDQQGGGPGENRRGGVEGDPTRPYPAQVFKSRVLMGTVSVPEYVIPYRPMVVRIAGGAPLTGPSRVSNVQKMILGFLGRLRFDEGQNCVVMDGQAQG